jgi:hypothetical protein
MPQTETSSVIEEAERHGRGDAQAGLERRTSKGLAEVLADAGHQVKGRELAQVYERYGEAFTRRASREDLVDAGSEMSFPASDPPSYMGGVSVAGAPPKRDAPAREAPNARVSDPSHVKDIAPTDGTGTDKSAKN